MKTNRQNPIYSITEDKLNRKHFIDYIINIIENASVKNRAFTIAVNGKWGEGKTSVKNLTIEKLLHIKKAANLAIMDFSFTEFQNQNELNKIFLAKLLDVIRNKKDKRKLLTIVNNNKKYFFYLFFFFILIAGFLYPNIFVKFSSIILTFLFIFKTQLRKVTVASIMDVISKFYIKVDVINKILFYDPMKEYGAENSRLIKYLEKENSYDKIVIFVDSFDSLNLSQLKTLMYLINSKLDLPKVVFVLFYDKSILEKCLTTNIYTGSDFIEKFVDIQLDLPLITDDILFNFLYNELQEKYNINIKYMNEFKYIKNYFMYLNKIYTFLDNFDLNYTLMLNNQKGNNFSFNKKDFFLMEILRFFENDIYRIIRKSKRILTKHNLKINANLDDFLPNIIKNIKNNSEENIKNLLFSIFPYLPIQLKLESIDNSNYKENVLLANKNVGCFDYFDYYFIYEMNEVIISEEKFNTIKKYLNDNKKFISVFKETFSIIGDSMIHKYAESVLRKLYKRINETEILTYTINNKEEQKEFLKNIIWLYIYSNRNSVSKEHLITVLMEYCKKVSFDNLINNLQLILDDFNYFNYFYVLEISNIIKYNLLDLINDNNQIQKEKYSILIDEIILKYVDLVLSNDEILKYLSQNSFNSRLQVSHIIAFARNKFVIKEKISAKLNGSHSLLSHIKSSKIKKFRESIENNYFNLIYLFVEHSIRKKIINGDIYSFLDLDSLYPFTIEELVKIFRKNRVSKNDKIFKLLLLSLKKM